MPSSKTPTDPARIAAYAVARVCRWTPVEDLVQSAYVGTLEALPRWDPSKATAEKWLFYAALYAARTAANRDRPAHALRLRVSISAVFSKTFVQAPMPKDVPDQSAVWGSLAVYEDAEWRFRARRRIHEVLSRDADTKKVAPVLLGEIKPAALARALGVDVSEIYSAEKRARRALKKDQTLKSIWSGHAKARP